jgi:predicted alpha/beta-fold hydrolase
MSLSRTAAAATAAAAAVLGIFLALRLRARALSHRTAVLCGDAALLLAACPTLASYTPPLLLPISGHASTLFSVFFRASPGLTYLREVVALPDGGEVALDFRRPIARGDRVVLLLHGLTGGSHERYLQWQIRALEAASPAPACVVLNARGCGGSRLATPLTFSAAWTADVREAVRLLRARAGAGGSVSAVGWSLGAGILTKFVCEEGAAGRRDLCAAVACAPSLDFFKSCARLEGPLARVVYNAPMARALHRYLRPHVALLQKVEGFNEAAALGAPTLRGVDAAAICPLHGFPSVEAYYAAASTARELKHVGVPLLVLAARDDPICDIGGLDEGAPTASGHVSAVVTAEGGHVAWPMGGWLPSREHSWENAAVVEWLRHVGAI